MYSINRCSETVSEFILICLCYVPVLSELGAIFQVTDDLYNYVFACLDLGCEFVLESCNNPNTYPYLCDAEVLHQCTFDHISKVCKVC